jgi:hypothetical protein
LGIATGVQIDENLGRRMGIWRKDLSVVSSKNDVGLCRARASQGKWRTLALAGALGLICLGAAVGDVLYVNRVSLPIRNGKFAFNKVVSTAVQGDTVTVNGVEGKWLKVTYAPKSGGAATEGYVLEDALTSRQVTAAAVGATGSATDVAAAGASRGLLDSGKYAVAKGLNPDPFYRMVTESRAAITDKAFDDFTKEARVGPYKPNPIAAAK